MFQCSKNSLPYQRQRSMGEKSKEGALFLRISLSSISRFLSLLKHFKANNKSLAMITALERKRKDPLYQIQSTGSHSASP